MTDQLADAPLGDVEHAVSDALASGGAAGLRVLGYGEITLVVGWPETDPRWACKRLPVFADAVSAERYGDLFDRYVAAISGRGLVPVPSAFRTVTSSAGTVVGYVVQDVLPTGTLGPDVLRAADPDPDHPLLRQVCELVPEVVDAGVGLDGQISNWALLAGTGEGQLRYLDLTTPMLFDAAGRFELDLGLFLAAYPWVLRAPIRRFVAPGVVSAYREPRHVLLDLVANLVKERLDTWIPAAITAANRVVDRPITEDEARAFYRSDARLWEVMLRLRRADRRWQQTVRRRTYPFLLPGAIER